MRETPSCHTMRPKSCERRHRVARRDLKVPRGAIVPHNEGKTSSFPQEIGCHKLFRLISSGNRPPQNFFGSFPQEISCHKTFSAHFLRKSAATKLFRLISSGNRLPQTFSAHFLRKSAATNFFGPFPQEIGSSLTHSFPQEIAETNKKSSLRYEE